MPLRNSDHSYGSIAKWLHWSIALLFLGSYISVYYRQWFTQEETPENLVALQFHLSIGVTIGSLVVLRILWRLMNPAPLLEPGSRLEHVAAHIGHFALYLIMIITPLTGYLGTGVNTDYFFLFEIPKFADTWLFGSWVQNGLGMTFEQFEEPVDFIHKEVLGEWLVWLLILGHVLAALYHHFIKKDRTLLRMTIDRDSRGRE
ncbi:cytochrome b [Microbulbifer sp. MLAF003]|uniref:cytochrome b n=1 Tax=unclassified Microbulbifer TaxID=2619833 RepID=UPI0024ACAA63|nr:cytochrome b [Microbulbifer sp. MLAF003]WHI53264.1 cytochrome b [Microbulbifer sp. MLAF003]